MGLFDGILGGFEKLERQGDESLIRGEPFQAYQRFEGALRKVAKKDPAAVERLKGKLSEARCLFVKAKIRESARFLEDEVIEAATESLEIAREHLDASDIALAGEIEQLEARVRRLIEPEDWSETTAEKARPPSAAGTPAGTAASVFTGAPAPDSNGLGQPAPQEAEEAARLEALFDQLTGSLPPEDQARVGHLGWAFKQGIVAHHLGRTKEALAALQRSLEEHPGEPLVLEYLALALDQLGKTGEARALYAKALENAPGRLNARIALATIMAGIEPPPGLQSFSRWQEAAASAPKPAPAGGANSPAGDVGGSGTPDNAPNRADALALLEDGIRIDAARASTYLTSAVEISLTCNRPAAAAGFATRAMEQGADRYPHLWHLYAVAMEMTGSLDEAEEAHNRAVSLGGQTIFFRAEFAEFALRHNRALKDAGEFIFDTCLGCQATRPSPEEMDYYGVLLTRIQKARGELGPALQGIERLLKQDPHPALEAELRRMRREVMAELESRKSQEDLYSGRDLDTFGSPEEGASGAPEDDDPTGRPR